MVLPEQLAAHLADPVLAPLSGVGRQGYGENAACGDELWLEVAEGPAGALEVRYRVLGCAALVAGASLWVSAVRAAVDAGEDAAALEPGAVLGAAGGLPARSRHVERVITRAWSEALGRS